jgi:hypothetical protein
MCSADAAKPPPSRAPGGPCHIVPKVPGHLPPEAALVALTGRLPAHTQSGDDLWPPDAQANSLVDQLRECDFCPLLRNPGALDLLQHLGGRHPGSRLRLAWRLR